MLSLRTPIGLGAALSASLAASLLSGSPVQATPFTGNAPPAVDCVGQTGATIFSQGFACIIGDKVYSSFLNISGSPALDTAFFSFTNNAPNFSISIIPVPGTNFLPGLYEFGYSMTVFDAVASGQRIKSISTGATSSAQPTPPNPAYTQTLQATPTLVIAGEGDLGGVILATETRTNGNSPVNSGAINFTTPVVSADFISTLAVGNQAGNFVSNFNNSVIQLNAPPRGETVPGPLPILGAAAAFGMSRKLRRRIRQIA
ncbi:hypothetical protein [Synechococcus sp. CCY 0621]|uniref:hypothetical protein n=1 Tax=Synechococcus sp. CCY 0621 TaxID=2815603 RepID=UPI001C230911|nr:hypothetical protein [Synechococcus sp. CCY 0621]